MNTTHFRLKGGRRLLIALALTSILPACMLLDARREQQQMHAACSISGTVASEDAARPRIVLLIQRDEQAELELSPWRIVDHFVAQNVAAWRFAVGPGNYHLAAFEDANADLIYQPGEAFVGVDAEHAIQCDAGKRMQDIALTIPTTPLRQFDQTLDVTALQSQAAHHQLGMTLGQRTALGEIVTLDDPRFDEKKASDSLWRPYDFILDSRAGIYFLAEHDPHKTPVLFVHGINGSPANFAWLAEHLDRTQFEPWFYTYPSGVYLSAAADHLTQSMAKLQLRLGVKRLVVVAHSMGGLVSRGFLLRQAHGAHATVPLYITISTPWAGHEAAAKAEHSPVVLDVWRDMKPGSEYLRGLFEAQLPHETAHHLLFTFERNSASFGASGDHTVTVASQLRNEAQRTAAKLYGFDDSHMGVLRNEEVATLMNKLLAEVKVQKAALP